MTKRQRLSLAALIPAALAAGGIAGAGIGLRWYPPAVGVGLAALIGLAAGVFVYRTIGRARRARKAVGR